MVTMLKILTVFLIGFEALARSQSAFAETKTAISLRTQCINYFKNQNLQSYTNLSNTTLNAYLLFSKLKRNHVLERAIQEEKQRRVMIAKSPLDYNFNLRSQSYLNSQARFAYENQNKFRIRQTHHRQISIVVVENSPSSGIYLNSVGQVFLAWLQYTKYQQTQENKYFFQPHIIIAGSVHLFPEIEESFSSQNWVPQKLHTPYVKSDVRPTVSTTFTVDNDSYSSTSHLDVASKTLTTTATAGVALNQPVLHISFGTRNQAKDFLNYVENELFLKIEHLPEEVIIAD